MSNYNERLDEILVDNFEEIRVIGCTIESIDRRIAEAKQSLTSLIKELVAEAKPELPALFAGLGDISVTMYKKGTDEFEQNLLKALEEVNEL